jgi:hypothetical protein
MHMPFPAPANKSPNTTAYLETRPGTQVPDFNSRMS